MRNSNPVSRFLSLPTSRKRAIDAMCAHCMGCTENTIEIGFKYNIKSCQTKTCPLHTFRPYQDKEVKACD